MLVIGGIAHRGGTCDMKTLAEFTRTTLIGGVLIILPLYILL
jgi:hypothetical protein